MIVDSLMQIRDRVITTPGPRYAQKMPTKAAPFVVWPDYMKQSPTWRMVDLQSYIDEGFDINTLIYSAVMYKARASAIPPLRAYSGDADNPELLPAAHPLAKLVSRPNPNQSWREFQMLQTIFLNVAGESFIWFDRKGAVGGTPSAMYPLNPQRVLIVPGEKGQIKGYVYVTEGQSIQNGIPLLPQDVSHVKLPNPGDPLDGDGYGFSPISPLARSGDVDNMITHFLQIFFQRGAVPAGVLKFSVPLQDTAVATAKDRWRDMYGGYENWSEVGVLDNTGEYQRIGMNFDELGFDSLDERNESRILGPFGVPPILISSRLGLMRSTYANYETARKAYWEDTQVSELMLFEDDFKYYMQSDEGGFVAYDLSKVPALKQDAVQVATVANQAFSTGAITKNEYRTTIGFDAIEDGDFYMMPLNLVPMGAEQEPTTSTAQQPEATEDQRANSGKGEIDRLTMELKRANDLLESVANKNGHKKEKVGKDVG